MEQNENQGQTGPKVEDLKRLIEIKELQLRLQQINTEFLEAKVRELIAMGNMTQLQNKENVIEHVLVEEDFVNNPDLKEQGFKVGDQIGIPAQMKEEFFKNKDKMTVVKD